MTHAEIEEYTKKARHGLSLIRVAFKAFHEVGVTATLRQGLNNDWFLDIRVPVNMIVDGEDQ